VVPTRAVADGVARRAAGLPATGVKPWHCQVALAVTQTAFCVGSVYLKNNLRSLDGGQVFHPIIYALVRVPGAPPLEQRRRVCRSVPVPPVRPRLAGTRNPSGEPGAPASQAREAVAAPIMCTIAYTTTSAPRACAAPAGYPARQGHGSRCNPAS